MYCSSCFQVLNSLLNHHNISFFIGRHPLDMRGCINNKCTPLLSCYQIRSPCAYLCWYYQLCPFVTPARSVGCSILFCHAISICAVDGHSCRICSRVSILGHPVSHTCFLIGVALPLLFLSLVATILSLILNDSINTEPFINLNSSIIQE